MPPRFHSTSSPRCRAVLKMYSAAFKRQVAVHEQRVVNGLREHAEQLDRLAGGHADQVEHRVVHVALEDVARLVLGGRHPLDRMALEDLANELRLRDLEEEAVLDARVDLVGVAEPHLLVGAARRAWRTLR